MSSSFYRRCAELLDAGRSVVVVTVLEASGGSPAKQGFKMLVGGPGETYGTVGGGKLEHRATAIALDFLSRGGVRVERVDLTALGMACGGEVTLLFEHVEAGRSFLLFGGGHVGRALAPALVSLGFRVMVYDSRREAREWLAATAGVSVVVGPYEDLSAIAGEARRARHCFIATHGHEHDWDVLRQLLELSPEWSYVGMIGSRRKASETHEQLRASGRSVPGFLYCPAGVRIGGSSPAEIALSVAAEVVAVTTGADVEHMRFEVEPDAAPR